MNFLEIAQKRKSIRQFSDKEIETEKLDYILESVRLAPSAVNFQPWFFYIIKSDESKALIKKCYDRNWFVEAKAPVYILACIDRSQSWKRGYDHKDHGDIDIAIAVEHLCMSAAEQGLGTCWVCHFDPTLCKELFQLPEHLEAAVIIPLGYPENEEENNPKRKSLEEIFKTI